MKAFITLAKTTKLAETVYHDIFIGHPAMVTIQ